MKITKTANNKKRITLSKREWESIGEKAGWMKTSQFSNAQPQPDVTKASIINDFSSFLENAKQSSQEVADYISKSTPEEIIQQFLNGNYSLTNKQEKTMTSLLKSKFKNI